MDHVTLKTVVTMLEIQLYHRNKLHLNRHQKVILISNNISQFDCFYCIFDQIAALVSRLGFGSKPK